jgi:hypothetical protein
MAWTIRQMDDFAGWPVWGWLSPGGIPCLNPVFHLGPFRSACGPYRCSHRAGYRRPRSVRRPWQIGHSAGAISAAPQEVAVAAQLQGWMLAWGISGACQITSEHFWIDGGDCGEGRAVSLVAADRATSCCSGASAEAVPFPGIAGRSTSLLRFSRRKESNEVGYE